MFPSDGNVLSCDIPHRKCKTYKVHVTEANLFTPRETKARLELNPRIFFSNRFACEESSVKNSRGYLVVHVEVVIVSCLACSR